ncbi:MAG: hypothetical protein ACTSWX_16245 [Promethearchaeota archaeon]
MISVSLSFQYLLIFHRESEGLLYFKNAPDIEFDPLFIEKINYQIQKGYIQFRQIKNQIIHGMLDQYYLLLITSNYSKIILIVDEKPNEFTDEALEAFTVKFESQWEDELSLFYSLYQGNIDLFFEESKRGYKIENLINEIFHLNFNLPQILHVPKIKLQGNYKKVWKIAEELAKETGTINIRDLWAKSAIITKIDKDLLADIVYEFFMRGYFLPANSI